MAQAVSSKMIKELCIDIKRFGDFDKLKEQFDSYKVIVNNVSNLVISNELNKFKEGKK